MGSIVIKCLPAANNGPGLRKIASGDAGVSVPRSQDTIYSGIHCRWPCSSPGAKRAPIDMEFCMQDLWRLSAAEIAALIRSKQVSAKEAATAALARLDAVNPK